MAPDASAEGHAEDIGKAVIIAGLSAIVTGLIALGFEKLKAKTEKRKKESDDGRGQEARD